MKREGNAIHTHCEEAKHVITWGAEIQEQKKQNVSNETERGKEDKENVVMY